MKIRTVILSLGLVALFFSCDKKEKERLQLKIDSLSAELAAGKTVELTLAEIGTLIDSIDASRKILRTEMVEGTSYTDYISRLKDINQHIANTESKIAELEKSNKAVRGQSNNAIKRLKADLEVRAQEVLALQVEIEKIREQNKNLAISNARMDSTLTTKEEVIKMREQDIVSLEGLVKDINEQTKVKVANLYFAQAQALEMAAKRTNFQPRKKKETKREALELYKLSYSLGNQDAQIRIAELEKDLS